LKINEKHFGKDHPQTGMILTNLGNAYGSLGDYNKQRDHLVLSLKILEKHFGEDNPNIGITLFNLGEAYFNLRDSEKAYEYLKRGHNIFLKCYGADHQNTNLSQQKLQILLEDLLLKCNLTKEKSFENYEKALRRVAFNEGNNENMLRLLIGFGARIDAQDDDQEKKTALHWAVVKERVENVSVLLILGASASVKDGNRKTAKDYAKESTNEKIRTFFS